MIDYVSAHDLILAKGDERRVDAEVVSLKGVLHRIAAKEIRATDSNPRFDNSAMDGVALRAEMTEHASPANTVVLPLCATVKAGDPPAEIPGDGSAAVEIMTGAAIPQGCNAVVRLEDLSYREDGRVVLTKRAAPGDNIRPRGEDFSPGTLLVPQGCRIGPQHLMALAASGVALISVVKRPRVYVLCTGSEVVPHDAPYVLATQIRNSTAPFLEAVLTGLGAQVTYLGTVPDEQDALRQALNRAFELAPDLLLTQGGVSAGAFDLIPELFTGLGGVTHFHKSSIRPGKPILFGEHGSSAFFGLPGNPLSVAVGLRFFVKPYLRALLGEPPEAPQTRVLARDTAVPPGLVFFQRAREEDGGVTPLPKQGSATISSYLQADGWIAVRSDKGTVPAGSSVDWYPLF